MVGIISRTEGEGGGAEAVLCHLINSWDSSMPLLIITANGSSVARAAQHKGLPVVLMSFVPYKIWPNIMEVERKLKQMPKLSLVHAWNAKSFELGWYISKRLSVPLACTMHDHPASAYFKRSKLYFLKKISNASTGLVTVSDILKKECVRSGYVCPMVTITNGLPNTEWAVSEPKEQYIFRIGFLGMNSTVKGFEIVAEWIKQTVIKKDIEWRLYGEVCEAFQPILSHLQQSGFDNFKVMGRQPTEEIFAENDLLVHTSLGFDCYPTVLLEAARASLPAVASNRGGAAEIVVHGTTGFIFNPDQPMEGLNYCLELYTNKKLYAAMKMAARQRFDEKLHIQQMVDAYNNFWTYHTTSKS